MKKLFLLLMFVFLTFTTFAAYQYDSYLQLNGTSLNVLQNANLSLTFISNITDWSTFILETIKSDETISYQNFEILSKTINIGNVNSGDNLKFYLSNNLGETTKNNLTFLGSGWDVDYNTYEYLHFGANYSDWDSKYNVQQFQINGSSPSGQPFPVVLATLALGSAGIILIKKRKGKCIGQ